MWSAIEATQLAPSLEYWLITQDDHARLSGEIAAAIGTPWAPRPSDEVVEAIALHDSGWTLVEAELGARAEAEGRRPPSFLEVPVPDFLRAWTGSIECAARRSAVAGILVSAHFASIGKQRLRGGGDPPEVRARLEAFEESESERRHGLAGNQRYSPDELAALLDLLQFCDLASLYLCGGARAEVEFPQRLGGKTIRLRGSAEEYLFDLSPLLRPVDLRVRATCWPSGHDRMLALRLR